MNNKNAMTLMKPTALNVIADFIPIQNQTRCQNPMEKHVDRQNDFSTHKNQATPTAPNHNNSHQICQIYLLGTLTLAWNPTHPTHLTHAAAPASPAGL